MGLFKYSCNDERNNRHAAPHDNGLEASGMVRTKTVDTASPSLHFPPARSFVPSSAGEFIGIFVGHGDTSAGMVLKCHSKII
jgi:hypothetical protein